MQEDIFQLHIGIDFSGVQTPTPRLAGPQVYVATKGLPEQVVTPAAPESKRWNRTRLEIAEWLIAQARSGRRFIAGIDHGFSFPLDYLRRHKLTSWPQFLEDFVEYWPFRSAEVTVKALRCHDGTALDRTSSDTDLRLTEKWTSSANGVLLLDVQRSGAYATHTGLPRLLHIRTKVGDLVHFWPFDGWKLPTEKSVIVEVYPSIFRNRYPREDRTADQQDAYAIARWLTEMDKRGFLERYFDPPLTDDERQVADLEGWILGIM